MDNKIQKINRIFLDGNDNIVIQDVTDSNITINKNNTEEIKKFFSQFGDKIMELEDIISGNKSEFAELKTILVEQFAKVKKTVMVVGTGEYNLNPAEYKVAYETGKLLAQMNFNLNVGGWEGVDYVVAEEFSKVIAETDFKLSDKLTQIVKKGNEPVFKGGQVKYVEQGVMEWIEGLKTAKALIIIGGNGGTYETFLYALQEKVAVIPVWYSGGDAQRIYDEISSNKNKFKHLKFKEKTFENLKTGTFLSGVKEILEDIFN